MDNIQSRKRTTMFAAVAAAAVVLAAGGIFVPRILGDTGPDPLPPVGKDTPSPEPTLDDSVTVDETEISSGECSDLPFQPTYLPDGFSYELQPGHGGQVGVPLKKQSPQAYGHWGGAGFISVFEQGGYYVLAPDAERISIFDQGAGVTDARFGVVHEGFSLEFKANGCDYSMIGFGVTEEDMRTFAGGLVLTKGLAEEEGYAIFPYVQPELSAKSCVDGPDWRRNPQKLVRLFAVVQLELGTPQIVDQSLVNEESYYTVSDRGAAIAIVHVREVGYRCWSVVSVGPVSEVAPSVHSYSFHDRTLELGLTNPKDGYAAILASANFRGGPTYEQMFEFDVEPSESMQIGLDLDSDPQTQGAFLVLFYDEEGETIGAFGMPLPAHDAAAG